jgi:hypothetical protein
LQFNISIYRNGFTALETVKKVVLEMENSDFISQDFIEDLPLDPTDDHFVQVRNFKLVGLFLHDTEVNFLGQYSVIGSLLTKLIGLLS